MARLSDGLRPRRDLALVGREAVVHFQQASSGVRDFRLLASGHRFVPAAAAAAGGAAAAARRLRPRPRFRNRIRNLSLLSKTTARPQLDAVLGFRRRVVEGCDVRFTLTLGHLAGLKI